LERNSKGQFEKGIIPWNKETKGVTKENKTSFKKGAIPWCDGTKGEGKVKKNKGSFKKGHKMSQETKDKIKETMKNNPKISGKNSHMYGKKGKLSNNWKGGVTPFNKLVRNTFEYKEWRESIYKRDNYTCQNKNCKFCNNKRGTELHPHHIKLISEFPDLIFDINNGITYCKKFHLKSGLHKKKIKKGKVL